MQAALVHHCVQAVGTTGPANTFAVSGSAGTVNIGAKGWIDPGTSGGSIVADNGTYKALMIVGNNISGNSGNGREVGVWDFLNIHGRAAIGYGNQTAAPSNGLAVSGNVGIGTTAPGTNLDVAGNINASIYYDRDNTNYYVDPAANTMPYAANLNGDIVQDGNLLSSIGAWTTVSTTANWYTVGYLSGGRGYGEFLVENTQSSQHQVIKFIASIQYGNGAQITVLQNSDYSNMPFTAIRIAQLSTNTVYGAYAVQVYGYDLYGTGTANRVRMMNQGNNGWVIYNFTTAENANYVATAAQVSLTQASMVESGSLAVGGSMYSIEHDNGTVTGATTINWASGNTQTLVLGASPIALTFNNGQAGAHYTLALEQDGTGSRTVTWPANVRWSSGVAPTLTTTANKTDYVEFVYDGLSSTFDGVGFNANF